jgi:resuscitation-promoting factor RpfB
VRRSVSYGLAAAVGASALTGGAVAWAAVDKDVTITVDGQAKHLHTTADTVSGAIADAGLRVSAHDVVAPTLQAKVSDGSEIVVLRGRLLHLTIDGVQRNVWVTASTVSQALDDLGYADAKVESVSRSTRLPLTASSLQLQSAKQVTITHDGMTTQVTTTDETVGQLLGDLHIAVNPADQLAPVPAAAVTDGLQVVIRRVTTTTVTATQPIAFAVTQTNDATLAKGSSVVVTAGVNGQQTVLYSVTYIDGVAAGQVALSSTPVSAPRTQVVRVGTKVAPVAPVAAVARSTSGLNWDGVAKCESNNHWNDNTGNGYYGGLQFSASTWLSNGGGVYAPRADLATEAQQIAVATTLYLARGSAPWPVCGKYL